MSLSGLVNAQDKHTVRESTTLPHLVCSPEQILNDAEQSPKGETDGPKGEIDDKAERNQIRAELREKRIEAERQIQNARAELNRLDSLKSEIDPEEFVRGLLIAMYLHQYDTDLGPRLDRFLSEDE
jgi:hypothetical protein